MGIWRNSRDAAPVERDATLVERDATPVERNLRWLNGNLGWMNRALEIAGRVAVTLFGRAPTGAFWLGKWGEVGNWLTNRLGRVGSTAAGVGGAAGG